MMAWCCCTGVERFAHAKGTMMKIVEYVMSPISPFVYLGHDRLRAICAARIARIELRVIDLGKIFPKTGGLALKDRAPARQAYRLVELARWSDFLGLPLLLEPKHFPVPALAAATLLLAVRQRHGTERALDVAGDLLRALWANDRNLADAGTLAGIVAAQELDPDPLLLHAASAETAARYEEDTQSALAAGVFGAPTYRFRGELFWGQDRLDLLERALAA
jgi:2-hydroxychromene-2-carboxylate isomerase